MHTNGSSLRIPASDLSFSDGCEQVNHDVPRSHLQHELQLPGPSVEQREHNNPSPDPAGGTKKSGYQQSPQAVRQEDTLLEMCREMSQWGSDTSLPTLVGQADEGLEVVEYHDGTNSMTILGEVFGQGRKHRRSLVRVVLPNSNHHHGQTGELSGLDDADVGFLRKKGALDLPPRKIWYDT